MPEVDGVLGTGSYYDIVSAARQVLEGKTVREFGDIDGPADESARILTTPSYYAYLKIAEGCDNHCAYCVIPSLRGKYRSRKMEDLLAEARALAEDGVKELIVVAQDTSRYGIDLYGERKLAELLTELCKIDGFVWIRVHYLYPDEMSEELIDVLANEPKIVKYLDIPIQHIDDPILRSMNRRGNSQYLRELFTKLRARIPGLVLRTSLITGLPGEGEREFEELCDFLREYKLERVGAFAFSPEEGTKAAQMEHPDLETAQRRAEAVAELQSRIMDEYNEQRLGETMEVLCEGYDPDEESYYGRTYADSPDIDGRIWFTSPGHVPVGSFVDVQVVDTCDGELVGIMEEEKK
jgi:ribosomal protein S12 methylthiotransferase